MIMVTNTISIRKGHGRAVAERFKNPKGVHRMPGFVRMELLLSESGEQDELKVMTLWETREAFDGWVNSDSFKQAHAGRGKPAAAAGAEGAGAPAHAAAAEEGRPSQSEEGPVMLGAKLSIHEVLFAQQAEGPVQSEG